mmetsp:Transcript_38022/g.90330  ORF Transcript_38022/g.90330 Transcript_38022/m.90330 type:complete len:257 (-) Transcript_38022:1779-2549(-)
MCLSSTEGARERAARARRNGRCTVHPPGRKSARGGPRNLPARCQASRPAQRPAPGGAIGGGASPLGAAHRAAKRHSPPHGSSDSKMSPIASPAARGPPPSPPPRPPPAGFPASPRPSSTRAARFGGSDAAGPSERSAARFPPCAGRDVGAVGAGLGAEGRSRRVVEHCSEVQEEGGKGAHRRRGLGGRPCASRPVALAQRVGRWAEAPAPPLALVEGPADLPHGQSAALRTEPACPPPSPNHFRKRRKCPPSEPSP